MSEKPTVGMCEEAEWGPGHLLCGTQSEAAKLSLLLLSSMSLSGFDNTLGSRGSRQLVARSPAERWPISGQLSGGYGGEAAVELLRPLTAHIEAKAAVTGNLKTGVGILTIPCVCVKRGCFCSPFFGII